MSCRNSTICGKINRDIRFSSYRNITALSLRKLLRSEERSRQRPCSTNSSMGWLECSSSSLVKGTSSRTRRATRRTSQWILKGHQRGPLSRAHKVYLLCHGPCSHLQKRARHALVLLPQVPESHPQDLPGSFNGHCKAMDEWNRWWTPLNNSEGLRPAQKAKTTQSWLLNTVPHHWSPDL